MRYKPLMDLGVKSVFPPTTMQGKVWTIRIS